jgi:hypothetical protein
MENKEVVVGKPLEHLRDELFEELQATEEEKKSVEDIFLSAKEKTEKTEKQKTGDKIMDDMLDSLNKFSKQEILKQMRNDILGDRPKREHSDNLKKEAVKISEDSKEVLKNMDQQQKENVRRVENLSDKMDSIINDPNNPFI